VSCRKWIAGWSHAAHGPRQTLCNATRRPAFNALRSWQACLRFAIARELEGTEFGRLPTCGGLPSMAPPASWPATPPSKDPLLMRGQVRDPDRRSKEPLSPDKSSCAMLKPATALFFVLSVGGYLSYKYWTTYPNLIPNQRAVRRIDRRARRRGISLEAAYIQWSNRRLRRSRYHYLARGS
jgi:hypothetical protein